MKVTIFFFLTMLILVLFLVAFWVSGFWLWDDFGFWGKILLVTCVIPNGIGVHATYTVWQDLKYEWRRR